MQVYTPTIVKVPNGKTIDGGTYTYELSFPFQNFPISMLIHSTFLRVKAYDKWQCIYIRTCMYIYIGTYVYVHIYTYIYIGWSICWNSWTTYMTIFLVLCKYKYILICKCKCMYIMTMFILLCNSKSICI